MELCDLNPYIRFCWIRKVGEDYSEPLLAYDFRLFYGLEGEFIIEAEGKIFNVTPNRFVVIPPATPYILSASVMIMPSYPIFSLNKPVTIGLEIEDGAPDGSKAGTLRCPTITISTLSVQKTDCGRC